MRKTTVLLLLCLFSIQNFMAQENEFTQIIKNIGQEYAPDRRVEVFQAEVYIDGDSVVIKGETTNSAAYNELIAEVKRINPLIKDSVRLLPDADLGNAVFGVIYNSVGTLRYSPRYSSEMVTQTLLGTPVKIIEKRGGWRRVQTPDKYIGWINGSVEPMTQVQLDNYNSKPKVIVISNSVCSYEKPSINSYPVSDLVVGNILALKSEIGDFYEVTYPDGREGFVKSSEVMKIDDWLNKIILTGESIVNNAYRFKGVPYLWGGTSAKGMDCSGFTKTVYFIHGIVLARDASQQVNQGLLVDSEGDFSKLLPGDLIFFGSKSNANNQSDNSQQERVVHVGIYIGNNHFIHASDYIRINSLNPKDPLYDEFNTKRYLRTKRYIVDGQAVNVEKFNSK